MFWQSQAASKVVKVASRLDDSALDVILETLLHQNPTARVLAVGEDGAAVPIPESLRLIQHEVVVGAASIHELVSSHAGDAVTDTWKKAQTTGVAQAFFQMASGNERRMVLYLVDARRRHGVYLCVIASVQERFLSQLGLEHEHLRPRHCAVRMDDLGTFLSIDATTPRVLGWDTADILGRRTLEFLHPEDVPKTIACWCDLLTHPGAERNVRFRFRHRDGSWIWLEASNHNRLDEPQLSCVDVELLDISDEMATLEALRISEQSLIRLANALPLGVLQIDSERRILYCNERLGQIVGNHIGSTAEDILLNLTPSDCGQLHTALNAVLEHGENTDIEVRLQHQRGMRHCSIALRALTDQIGGVTGAILCVGDVTEDARMRQDLHQRANYDRLTQCYNRASILSSLDRILLEACLRETGTGVLFVDLDHFKPINDELGHAAGDQLLTVIAERLLNTVRADDRVGRFGGDEFLIVCPDVYSPEDALAIAERISLVIKQPLNIHERQVIPSASIGVGWCSNGTGSAEALVARADAAMYVSKSERRGCPVLAPSESLPEKGQSRRPRHSRSPLVENPTGGELGPTTAPSPVDQK
jgi:diguanylate cyclase (GGDEF)-like protein/PAS domain S-box-containing protein